MNPLMDVLASGVFAPNFFHAHSVWQMFEFFLVGAGALVVIFAACALLLSFLQRFESPVERWFLRHRGIGKLLQIAGCVFGCVLFVAAVIGVGCAMLEGKWFPK